MNKLKLFIFISIVTLYFTINNIIACPTDEKSLQKAQQVWEKAITAIGGRERVLDIKNLLYFDKKKTVVSLDVFPDKFWYWRKDRQPIGTSVLTYDFSKNIAYDIKDDKHPFSYPLTNQTKESILAGKVMSLLETKSVKPKLLGYESTKINNQEYDVICTEITYPDNQKDQKQETLSVDYIFDQGTHLLFRSVWNFDKSIGGGYWAIEYSNYTEVKGIKFASKIRSKHHYERDWTDFIEYTTEVDVDYRQDLFDKPPLIKDGPDGWKKKP